MSPSTASRLYSNYQRMALCAGCQVPTTDTKISKTTQPSTAVSGVLTTRPWPIRRKGTGNKHYDDVIMTMLASQITSLMVVYSIVYSGVNQRKHQSSASLAFVREIHRGPVNFPHKWPVTRKMFPFDDVIMECGITHTAQQRNHSRQVHKTHTMDMLWEKFQWILPLYMKPISFQSKASVVCSVATVVFIDFPWRN